MAKMRKGTHVGIDKNLKNICVGDRIKDADGNIYTIDSYGKAVGNGGSAFQLSEIQPFEIYLPAPEQPQEEPAPKELVLSDLTDHGPCVELERARKIICDNLKETDPGVSVLLPGTWEDNERQNEPEILDAIPDRVLALELRRRGWDVTATKTVSL